jgi:hypothetical protein
MSAPKPTTKSKSPKRARAAKAVEVMKFDTVDEWAKDINEAYDLFLKTGSARVEAIIRLGNKLIAMKEDTGPRAWFFAFDATKVEKPIPFSTSYAERLMEIARNPVLSNPDNRLHLPPTVSGLYALSRLDVEDPAQEYVTGFRYGKPVKSGPGTLARLMVEGRIFADMTVRDIESLLPPPMDDVETAPQPAPTSKKAGRKSASRLQAEQEMTAQIDFLEAARANLVLPGRWTATGEPCWPAGTPDSALVLLSVSPEAHCRLCDVRSQSFSARTQEEVTAWVKEHVQQRHLGDSVAVTLVIERPLPPPPEKPVAEEKVLPAGPPAAAEDDAAPAVNEAEESAAEGDDKPEAQEEDEEDDQAPAPPASQAIEPPTAEPDNHADGIKAPDKGDIAPMVAESIEAPAEQSQMDCDWDKCNWDVDDAADDGVLRVRCRLCGRTERP